ncbi:hypothetical protein [Corallococcus sp. CA053C]|uniref:hypothetical protein n=1 Tax=Corallococcus sp. CA053C TaxID=2316732 RepID=UPI0011C35F44|nr:hypothetical protein [Corallococcus sp. CA053C]
MSSPPLLPSSPRRASVNGGLARPWWRELPGWLLLWTLAAVALVSTCSDRHGVQGLTPTDRAALFQQTWDSFHSLCEEKEASGFTRRCREQARFLLLFPECDDACRARLIPWR